MSRATIVAAGGVLWRGNPAAPEVALVHRPAHQDWSLPKGKSKTSEHILVTALREVAEETGHQPRIGPRLATVTYPVVPGGRRVDKVVSYWSMRATGGTFVPSREVDDIDWLTFAEARRKATSESDRYVLDAFAHVPRATEPLVLVRDGGTNETAGRRTASAGQHLTRSGRLHAAALVPVLEELAVSDLLSADVPSCVDTLTPAATATGLEVQRDRRLLPKKFAGTARHTADRLHQVASDRGGLVVCAQRPVLAAIFRALSREAGTRKARDTPPRGGWWLLHCSGDRVVAYERFRSAA